MKARTIALLTITCLVALNFPKAELPRVQAIGVADVIEQNIYWGTDPTNPLTAHPGDTNIILSIVLANVGDDIARNVNATLHLAPPVDYTFISYGTPGIGSFVTKDAGDIDAGNTFTLTYTVSVEPNAVAAVYHYDLLISFKSARELQQVNKTVIVDVPITMGELHIQSTVTDPLKIFPDSYDNTVTVTIANSGNGLEKDVQVQLELELPFIVSSSGSNEIFLGNVPAGQTIPATFHVDVVPNATFGQYSVTLAEVIANQLIPIGTVPLYVAEKARFNILSINPDTLHPTDSGVVVTVQIQNIASVTAQSVRVELQVGNDITGTLTDFLSDIDPGQNKTAIFTIDVDSSMPTGAYSVGLRLDWTQDNNQYALDHTYLITLNVAPGVPWGPIILGLAVVVVVAAYFMKKKGINVRDLIKKKPAPTTSAAKATVDKTAPVK